MSKKQFATKIHNVCCPICNHRCTCGHHSCGFNSHATDMDWKTGSNSYFLQLAEKAEKIMDELKITQEDFLNYVAMHATYKEIPPEVSEAFEKYDFR